MTLSPDAIRDAVKAGLQAALEAKGGANASYIPYLAGVPSHLCGVCAITPDGQAFEAGDTRYGFAIESISKVFTLALALEQSGREAVRAKIGARPTGLPFNSVMALELHGDKPMSPLVNAGAIATASFIKASGREDRWNQILGCYRAFANAELSLSAQVNESEQKTNLHNRAIAWLLASAGNCFCDPPEALDVYTRQCSVLVNCADLAAMAGTLANRGVNPLSKKAVVRTENVPPILAEMAMEGLYDASGDWAFEVGLPGKSGVGGGVMAVAPGKLGIAAFSPPLDPWGNSVRAQKAVATVAQRLGLNLYSG
jgi:glutaminase